MFRGRGVLPVHPVLTEASLVALHSLRNWSRSFPDNCLKHTTVVRRAFHTLDTLDQIHRNPRNHKSLPLTTNDLWHWCPCLSPAEAHCRCAQSFSDEAVELAAPIVLAIGERSRHMGRSLTLEQYGAFVMRLLRNAGGAAALLRYLEALAGHFRRPGGSGGVSTPICASQLIRSILLALGAVELPNLGWILPNALPTVLPRPQRLGNGTQGASEPSCGAVGLQP
jgi:hypothetical protein